MSSSALSKSQVGGNKWAGSGPKLPSLKFDAKFTVTNASNMGGENYQHNQMQDMYGDKVMVPSPSALQLGQQP